MFFLILEVVEILDVVFTWIMLFNLFLDSFRFSWFDEVVVSGGLG